MVELQLYLPAQREAPSSARRALSGLSCFVSGELFECAELLLSELVTNSVRHSGVGARGYITVSVSVDGSVLRAEVADSGVGFDAAVRKPTGTQTSGYGLYLVQSLAARWGVADDGETRVWFELVPGVRERHSA